MKPYAQLTSTFSSASLWLAEHPGVVRVALIAMPILVALGAAMLAHTPVYACPVGGSGGTCGT